SATTSMVPVYTCGSFWHDFVPTQVTSKVSTCSSSPFSGPYPPAGVIDSTNCAVSPVGTRLTLPVDATAEAMSGPRVATIESGSTPEVWLPLVAVAIRVACPGEPSIGQLP